MGDIEATELRLYINNEGSLYSMAEGIRKNLVTKQARREYKHDLAVKAFGYLVEAGAKKYAKEFGSAAPALGNRRYNGQWYQMFDVPTRKAVAEELTRYFETEAKLGNYDYLLPQKYRALLAVPVAKGRKTGAQLDREIAASLAKRR